MKQQLEAEVKRCEQVVNEVAGTEEWREKSAASNLRKAQQELAAYNAGDKVVTLDRDAFLQRASELLGPFVQRIDGPRVWNRKDLGSAFISAEEYEARPDEWIVEVGVRTGRAPAHSFDCDAQGVCSPADGTADAARKLAEEFGLTCQGFEPCEKGWGSYSFC